MKKYNKVFVVTFGVDQLAEELYRELFPNCCYDLEKDFDEGDEKENHKKDIEHYTRVTESIIDAVQDNQDACAAIFNALNGWVKTETPKEREEKTLHEQTQDAVDDAVGESQSKLKYGEVVAINSIFSRKVLTKYDIDEDWYNSTEGKLVGCITKNHGSASSVSIMVINTDNETKYVNLNIGNDSLRPVPSDTLPRYKNATEKYA